MGKESSIKRESISETPPSLTPKSHLTPTHAMPPPTPIESVPRKGSNKMKVDSSLVKVRQTIRVHVHVVQYMTSSVLLGIYS